MPYPPNESRKGFQAGPGDFEEIQLHKTLEKLLFRIMQLNRIHREGIDIEVDAGKARDLREQIRELQEELDRIYEQISGGDTT